MLEYAVVKKEPPSLSGLKQQIFIAHQSWIPHFCFVFEKPVIHDFFAQLTLHSWTLRPCKGNRPIRHWLLQCSLCWKRCVHSFHWLKQFIWPRLISQGRGSVNTTTCWVGRQQAVSVNKINTTCFQEKPLLVLNIF